VPTWIPGSSPRNRSARERVGAISLLLSDEEKRRKHLSANERPIQPVQLQREQSSLVNDADYAFTCIADKLDEVGAEQLHLHQDEILDGIWQRTSSYLIGFKGNSGSRRRMSIGGLIKRSVSARSDALYRETIS
jgi:hypothetical protein